MLGLLFSSLCYFIEREEEDTQYTRWKKFITVFNSLTGPMIPLPASLGKIGRRKMPFLFKKIATYSPYFD
jgi:hypothetical protein